MQQRSIARRTLISPSSLLRLATTRPELTRWGFTSALRRIGLTPYQARKTFDRWLQAAGIPRVRRKRYLGHGKRDVTDDYEFYEVTEYLRDDAAKLRAALGPQKLK